MGPPNSNQLCFHLTENVILGHIQQAEMQPHPGDPGPSSSASLSVFLTRKMLVQMLPRAENQAAQRGARRPAASLPTAATQRVLTPGTCCAQLAGRHWFPPQSKTQKLTQ